MMGTVGVSHQDSDTLPTISLGRTGKQLTRYGLGGVHQLEISSEIVLAGFRVPV